jgi:hypothetical protein
LVDYDAAIEFTRRLRPEFGHTLTWQQTMERFTAERAAISEISRGRQSQIALGDLCQEFPGGFKKRERSPLLPTGGATQLPELNILPAGEDSAV